MSSSESLMSINWSSISSSYELKCQYPPWFLIKLYFYVNLQITYSSISSTLAPKLRFGAVNILVVFNAVN